MINILPYIRTSIIKRMSNEMYDVIELMFAKNNGFSLNVDKKIKYDDMCKILNNVFSKIYEEKIYCTTYIFNDEDYRTRKDNDYYINIVYELWDSGIFTVTIFGSDTRIFTEMIKVE